MLLAAILSRVGKKMLGENQLRYGQVHFPSVWICVGSFTNWQFVSLPVVVSQDWFSVQIRNQQFLTNASLKYEYQTMHLRPQSQLYSPISPLKKPTIRRKSIIFFSTGASVDFHCDLLQDATWPPRAGVRKKNDQRPTLKKVGKFIGLAKDAKKFGLQDLELL